MSEPSRIRVLAAVIRRDGRVLLCRRPQHKRHGGLWEFPGGKLEPGETLVQAAVREVDEELALRVTHVGGTLLVRSDPGSPFDIEFVEVQAEGDPQPLEHDALAWTTTADALMLALAPADREFVLHLQRLENGST